MNDKELNEMLNSWKTPPVPASLRESVRAGIAGQRTVPRRGLFAGWKLLVAGTAVAAVVFMLADTSAFPEKLKFSPPPFIVESEITLYTSTPGCRECMADAGPTKTVMKSYNQAGSEVVLAWSAPDHLMEEVLWATKLRLFRLHRNVARLLSTPDEEAGKYAGVYPTVGQWSVVGERDTLLNSGCRPGGRHGDVIGEQVLLNYPVVVFEDHSWKRRTTFWMAPALNCFALRVAVEAEQSDGSWTMMSDKVAMKVTMNR